MSKHPRSIGQALPLTVIATFVLIICGIGIFYILQIFGGSGEHKNATDAGILNLSKYAAVQGASVDPNKEFQTMFCSSVGLTGQNPVDLGTYNRMIGAATIVALNASADGLDSGRENSENVIKELEGANGLGARLKAVLADNSAGSWCEKYFSQTASANTERMAGSDSQALWDKSQYGIAYVESATGDVGASNVPVDKLVSNMPYSYDQNGLTGKTMDVPDKLVATDGGKYLHGYQPISIPNIKTPIYAVPTQPAHQPHLVSLNTFKASETQPGQSSGVVLPPNAFKGGALAKQSVANQMLSSTAAGVVGMPGDISPSQARLPQGFLVIDNSLRSKLNPYIKIPNGDNWEAIEAGTGTLVYRPKHIFSTESTVNGQPYNALSSWLNTPRDGNFDPSKGPAIQDDEGNALLYDGSGNPITSKADAAQQIPYDTNPNNVVLATDENSDQDGSNPDADATLLATPTLPDNLSPFNRAYHPNANSGLGDSNGYDLIASEQAKIYALGLYGPHYRMGSHGTYDQNFGFTGLRLYPGGQLPNIGGPYTYAPKGVNLPLGNPDRVGYGDNRVLGKITTDGTIRQLFEQTTGNQDAVPVPYVRVDNDSAHARAVKKPDATTPATEVEQFIMQRMKEIKPTADGHDFDKVLKQTIPLGQKLYVYLVDASKANSEFVVSTMPPKWHPNEVKSQEADGKRHAFTATYSISGASRDTGYMIDSPNDFGIHDHLFMTNTVEANATDAVSYQSSSGANGLLGYIKFIEFVQASGNLTIPNNPQ